MSELAPAAPTLRADPLADDAIAAILAGHDGSQWDAIAIVNRLLGDWQSNAIVTGWRAPEGTPAPIAAALGAFLADAARLPDWADARQIARAEELFFDMSMLSCSLLFCASLPECYVVPDLAGVLHVAGQLEAHCDYRVRSTAAMIFPVMMRGGLETAEGAGIAQILKVRLIHATIRHLILRGNPSASIADGGIAVEPLDAPCRNMYDTLYNNGWDVAANGLPCNQEELAYTLLTFHYIFLRGLRRLGLGLPQQDEQAYLHTWNVVGHLLGIETALMPQTMEQAEASFNAIQARARLSPYLPDPRPALGAALMKAMQDEIPLRILKPFPVLLTRYLCGDAARVDLALNQRVNLVSCILFAAGMGLVRGIDSLLRLVLPGFSICRMITRIFGYQFTVKFLMNETRPLKLPPAVLNQVGQAVQNWGNDPKAPGWMNALEARLAGRRTAGGQQPC
ncbi:oxygenase MpaB family protein [Pseudoduganella violaceinigra]|uniref:oxygenase MpaB family protein n=1 Tax=Pseudoduganella violaceinigra TaxID=246602 RepID=UPI0003F76218|nr:oxygenase MpaB family protein [Pseudoduganella violaceinigra]